MKFRLLCVALGMTILFAGCGTAASIAVIEGEVTKQQEENEILENEILENVSSLWTDSEVIHKDEGIILNEWGYTYTSEEEENITVEIKEGNEPASESGQKAEAGEASEKILSWSEAQDYLEKNQWYWLNNECLKSSAEDISFIVADNDEIIAKYFMQNAKVEIDVVTVKQNNKKNFQFGRKYTSELYNVHQIEEGNTWQCFSHDDYDGVEHISAVLADGNIVCEISFEGCEEDFICETLACYKK